MSVSASHSADGEDLQTSVQVWNAKQLEEYLQATRECCQSNKFALTLNEKHRQSMLRAITNTTKSEYKQQLRELQTRQQWELADEFIQQDLVVLLQSDAAGIHERAPKFATGMEIYLGRRSNDTDEKMRQMSYQRQQPPNKFFLSLAGGRTYQGNMERLLQDLRPDAIPTYQAVVQEVPEHNLMRLFVEFQYQQNDDATCQLLLQKCLDMTFVTPPNHPADGGRSKGKRGENDLTTYLSAKHGSDGYPHRQILSPVWIRERNPAKNTKASTKQHYVLEVPIGTMKEGMTNEFDAMVVSLHHDNGEEDNKTFTIEEVWDAKASIDPTSMYDILNKKVSTLEAILQPEILLDTNFVIRPDSINTQQPRTYAVMVEPAIEEGGVLPQIGLFGSRFPSPHKASQKLQVAICEHLLETDRNIVESILLEDPLTGKVSAPQEVVNRRLSTLEELVRRIQPVLVVPSSIQATE